MTRKIVVDGTEYDSPDAMPPDVRRRYERALELVRDVAQGTAPQGTTERMVETTRDGVSVKVHTKQVKYTMDGKTYDDPAKLPPAIRAQVEQALAGAARVERDDPGLRQVRVVDVSTETHTRPWVPRIVWWLLIGTVVALVLLSRR